MPCRLPPPYEATDQRKKGGKGGRKEKRRRKRKYGNSSGESHFSHSLHKKSSVYVSVRTLKTLFRTAVTSNPLYNQSPRAQMIIKQMRSISSLSKPARYQASFRLG